MGLRSFVQRLRGTTPEAEDFSGLDWTKHAVTLAGWSMASPDMRENHHLPSAFAAGEQADAIARRYLQEHGLEDLLAEDSDAAFIAYSAAELVVLTATYALFQMERGPLAGLDRQKLADVRAILLGGLGGTVQRLTWHAAAHMEGQYDVEPYGPGVDLETLAHLDFEPQRPNRKETPNG